MSPTPMKPRRSFSISSSCSCSAAVAAHDPQESVRIDIAPAEDDRATLSGIGHHPEKEGGDPDRAAALQHHLLFAEGVAHGGGDLFLADEHHLVDMIAHELESVAVVQADAAAEGVGERF